MGLPRMSCRRSCIVMMPVGWDCLLTTMAWKEDWRRRAARACSRV